MKIFIIAHKDTVKPGSSIYSILKVGQNKDSFNGEFRDDQGVNISYLNKNYCELTALYWMWKNYDDEVLGLVHYRRYFTSEKTKKEILDKNEIKDLMLEYDVILPRKRNYYITTVKNHYTNSHNKDDLDKLRSVISIHYPDYLNSFDLVMNGKTLHLYNMFVMRKEAMSDYCEWLFSILELLSKEIDISNYDSYQSRIFGFLSERLFNVWLQHYSASLRIKELKVRNTEGERVIMKGLKLVARTLKGI